MSTTYTSTRTHFSNKTVTVTELNVLNLDAAKQSVVRLPDMLQRDTWFSNFMSKGAARYTDWYM